MKEISKELQEALWNLDVEQCAELSESLGLEPMIQNKDDGTVVLSLNTMREFEGEVCIKGDLVLKVKDDELIIKKVRTMKWTYIKDGNIDEIPEGVLCLFWIEWVKVFKYVSVLGKVCRSDDRETWQSIPKVLEVSGVGLVDRHNLPAIIKWCLFEEPSEPEDEEEYFSKIKSEVKWDGKDEWDKSIKETTSQLEEDRKTYLNILAKLTSIAGPELEVLLNGNRKEYIELQNELENLARIICRKKQKYGVDFSDEELRRIIAPSGIKAWVRHKVIEDIRKEKEGKEEFSGFVEHDEPKEDEDEEDRYIVNSPKELKEALNKIQEKEEQEEPIDHIEPLENWVDPSSEFYKDSKKKGINFIGFYKNRNVKINNQPHTCPVCNGNGIIAKGFYGQTSGSWSSTGGVEKCRSCDGIGVVWG